MKQKMIDQFNEHIQVCRLLHSSPCLALPSLTPRGCSRSTVVSRGVRIAAAAFCFALLFLSLVRVFRKHCCLSWCAHRSGRRKAYCRYLECKNRRRFINLISAIHPSYNVRCTLYLPRAMLSLSETGIRNACLKVLCIIATRSEWSTYPAQHVEV